VLALVSPGFPKSRFDHASTESEGRKDNAMFLTEFLVRKGRPKIRVMSPNQSERFLQPVRLNLMVRRAPPQPVNDSLISFSSHTRNKPANLPLRQSKLFSTLTPSEFLMNDVLYHFQFVDLPICHGQCCLH
jgi:hypothetical protein